MCLVEVEGAPRPVPACADACPRGHGGLDERRDGRHAPHAHGDAARRAPEREPRRPAERAHGPRRRRSARRRRSSSRTRSASRTRTATAYMGYDPDACILCNRCVRYTQEVMQCSALIVRRARRRGADRPHPRRLVARHRVRALRRLPLRLPDRRDLREVHDRRAARPRAGAREDEDDVHVLRRRLPDRPQRRPRDEADREGDVGAGVPPQRGQPLRQGPLRLQLRPPSGPADRAARARRGRRAPPDRLGHGARDRRRRADAA